MLKLMQKSGGAYGMKISISFKENENDLYNFLKNKRSPSNYVKDLLEEEMKKKDIEQPKGSTEQSKEAEFIGFDF